MKLRTQKHKFDGRVKVLPSEIDINSSLSSVISAVILGVSGWARTADLVTKVAGGDSCPVAA